MSGRLTCCKLYCKLCCNICCKLFIQIQFLYKFKSSCCLCLVVLHRLVFLLSHLRARRAGDVHCHVHGFHTKSIIELDSFLLFDFCSHVHCYVHRHVHSHVHCHHHHLQTKTRQIAETAMNGGTECEGPSRQTQPCYVSLTFILSMTIMLVMAILVMIEERTKI